ncbi:FkbM family methyltransferase [Rhodocytophaga aerolata]|uniref:FkbM family methyltransferase n=1 Tax=Rhodocytophaga aerolata TaxID=455078 RepID=A0ABT8RCQ6_9BACT|nr:FkbM family methyltransferase [Rhodocytophaga aerolata]MDO1449794.1 FkbM family methyltransferase [Rhodocytophaga aerolata]
MINATTYEKFIQRYHINQKGGIRALWQRRNVLVGKLFQQLNINRIYNVPLFWGDYMNIVTNESTSNQIMNFGYTEVAITIFMLHYLQEGDTVIDVGTHFGYEAMLVAHLLGNKGKIICFEPNPSSYKLAESNLKKIHSVKLYQAAVADKPGRMFIQNKDISESAFNTITDKSDNDSVEVDVKTLDGLLNSYNKIDLIKCDVEGFEIEVIKGAANLLERDRPTLILEADMPSSEGYVSERACKLAAHLKKYDYKPLIFDFKDKLQIGGFNTFPVFHANILFVHESNFDRLLPFYKT